MSHGIGFLVSFFGGTDIGALFGGSAVEVPEANTIPVEKRRRQRMELIFFCI